VDSHPYNVTAQMQGVNIAPSKKGDKGGSSSALIYKSEIIQKQLSPTWQPFQLSVASCGGLDGPLTIDVFDWYTSVSLIMSCAFECTNAKFLLDVSVASQ
jgi:hypothetical protein